MSTLIFWAQFIASGVGATLAGGDVPTVDVDRIAYADGTRSALVTGGTAIDGVRRGLWGYRLTDADLATYSYVATFVTTNADVDQKELAALGMVVPDVLPSTLATAAALATVDSNVDAILADTGTDGVVVATASVSAIAAAVWSATTRTLTSLSALLSSIAAAVWSYTTRSTTQSNAIATGSDTIAATAILGPAYTGLSIGYRVLNLDRSTYSAFTTDDVAETDVDGTYTVSGGALVPSAGGYIVWGIDGTDYAEADLPPTMTAASIWTYATRTVSQSAASVTAAVSGSDITILRGDTVTISLTGIGSLVGRDKLWFTAKHSTNDPDTASVIQIEETAGLLYFNGAAATAAHGSLTVTDEDAGNIDIVIKGASGASLVPGALVYDVQMLIDVDPTTKAQGYAEVVGDVTKAVA